MFEFCLVIKKGLLDNTPFRRILIGKHSHHPPNDAPVQSLRLSLLETTNFLGLALIPKFRLYSIRLGKRICPLKIL